MRAGQAASLGALVSRVFALFALLKALESASAVIAAIAGVPKPPPALVGITLLWLAVAAAFWYGAAAVGRRLAGVDLPPTPALAPLAVAAMGVYAVVAGLSSATTAFASLFAGVPPGQALATGFPSGAALTAALQVAFGLLFLVRAPAVAAFVTREPRPPRPDE
jgi:hypothetical protein